MTVRGVCCVMGVGLLLAVLASGLGAGVGWDEVPEAPIASELAAGWRLKPVSRFPETVTALCVEPRGGTVPGGRVYVGTADVAGLYRIDMQAGGVFLTVAEGLGDQKRFGTCAVNAIRIRDLDDDGVPEVLATTSQILPRGRPRLYVWSTAGPLPVLASLARPEIGSSWSHGLAFLDRGAGEPPSTFVTYCGQGEIVEFRSEAAETASGFRAQTVGWKQVGQLAASGESATTADLDNDGRSELCIATGYAPGAAAVLAFRSAGPGEPLVETLRVDEEREYGNVRFLVGDLGADGVQDLVAWWVSDHIKGGACAMVRYTFGPEGIRDRTRIATHDSGELWPDDSQAVLVDLDGRGGPEVCFATRSGHLWRYDPAGDGRLDRLAVIPGGIGPIAGHRAGNAAAERLVLGSGDQLLILSGAESASERGIQVPVLAGIDAAGWGAER